MEYTRLGTSGLKISRIALGCMSFGDPAKRLPWVLDDNAGRADLPPGRRARRAVAWFAARGVRVERVVVRQRLGLPLHAWRDACTELGVTPKHTRPYRPRPTARSNGSIALWPRAGPTPRCFPAKQHAAKPYRPGYMSTTITAHHTATGGRPPISRLTNLPEQYS